MREILIVGGGYAGFYAAWHLERRLHRGEAHITVVDPRPYMTYQPFLPEVMAGSVEARHAAVSLRRHLRRTTVVSGWVTEIDHATRTATIATSDTAPHRRPYDVVVVTAGAVTRSLAVPGLADEAIGLKHVEEAVAVRDHVLVAFDRAATLSPGPERDRLLTITIVGGGFTGVEGTGELLGLAGDLCGRYPELTTTDVGIHLVEAADRIMPEVSAPTATWVTDELRSRGAQIHLNARVVSTLGGHIVLSDGTEFDSGLLVWAAGNAANPLVAKHTDLPVDERGRLMVRADLRVGTESSVVPDAWGAGDGAAVPDLAAGTVVSWTVPNAQHAVRQGKLLAHNITAVLRGRKPTAYHHHSLGVVATLGVGHGVFESGPVVIKGAVAWLIHRGYHLLAVPTWERKVRILADWLPAIAYGRDILSLQAVQRPRAAFVGAGEPVELERATGSETWAAAKREDGHRAHARAREGSTARGQASPGDVVAHASAPPTP